MRVWRNWQTRRTGNPLTYLRRGGSNPPTRLTWRGRIARSIAADLQSVRRAAARLAGSNPAPSDLFMPIRIFQLA